MTRPTNPELCAAFRTLLTDGVLHLGSETIAATKGYRNELWKAFAEIEARLDPLGAETRRRADGKE